MLFNNTCKEFYYMDKGILLATKTLIESIRHYNRDPCGVFSVCHAREWYIDKFLPFLNMLTSSTFVELSEDDIYHFENNKKMLICL